MKKLFYLLLLSLIPLIIFPAFAQEDVEIPSWVKASAGWWSENLLTDEEYIESLEFLIDNNIIQLGNNLVVEKNMVIEETKVEDKTNEDQVESSEIENLETEINELKNTHKADIETTEKGYEDQISSLTEENETIKANYAKDLVDFAGEITRLNNKIIELQK